jgi:4-amino-4-deoxy-L-arabinose transferase-like glycosyltransferase
VSDAPSPPATAPSGAGAGELLLATVVFAVFSSALRWDALGLPAFWDELGYYTPFSYTFFENDFAFHLGWVPPVSYKPPLFAAALNLSHRWFTKGNQPYLIVMTNLREGVRTADKKLLELFYKAQFWAVIVPLASNLIVVFLTFFLGRLLFHERAGLIAAYMMAIHPVGIVTSNRVLIDDFLSLWVILAFLIFYWVYHRNSFLGSFASGIALGMALLSKQNAILLLPAMWLYVFCVSRKIFSPHFMIFAVTGIFLSASWYLRVYQTYGTPLYHPGYKTMVEMSKTVSGEWFTLLAKRPHPAILFSVGIPYLCPPMIFAYATLVDFWNDLRAAF